MSGSTIDAVHSDRVAVDAERRAVAERVEREQVFRAPFGVLSQVALHWLDESPQVLPALPGTWDVVDDTARVTVGAGEQLAPVEPDGSGAPIVGEARAGIGEAKSLHWLTLADGRRLELIRRTGRLGLRVLDPEAPARRAFGGLRAHEFDPAWIKDATFTAHPEPRRVTVDGAQPGLVHQREEIGVAEFAHDGRTHSLAVFGDHGVTAIFDDLGAGGAHAEWRVVPVEIGEDGSAVIDFNRATNFPAAFTPYGTCPKPPAENHLDLLVEAGELAPEPFEGAR